MNWLMILQIVALIGILVSIGTFLTAALLAQGLRKRMVASATAPVVLFKPICGDDSELAENLRSFCRQDYPNYRVVFGVADENDAALRVARQIREEFSATAGKPNLDIVIITGAPSLGANAKASNLAHMAKTLFSHPVLLPNGRGEGTSIEEIWVVSDADVRVAPDWLQQIVAPFSDEKVGLASCFYRMSHPLNLPTALEAFQINVDYLSGILMANQLFQLPICMGATMAMRRTALEKIGGFGVLADFLADDYQLGAQIAQVGYDVVIVNHVVDIAQTPMTWRVMWAHQVRWARTYRACQPAGFFLSIFANGFLWPTVLLTVTFLSGGVGRANLDAILPPLVVLCATTFLLRLISAQELFAVLTGRKGVWKWLWLAPVRDALSVALWVAAFAGNTVTWGGQKFRLLADGKMKEIAKTAL